MSSSLLSSTSIMNTKEPHYKEGGYNKPSLYNKVNLLVPALYIICVFLP